MTIDNLKCFLLVAENLSFARTAETLYISQPAVTKQINALERELGVTLFIRSTRHVELTPAGMSFYRDAKEIVQKSQIAVDRVHQLHMHSDVIRIGLSNSIFLYYLTPILADFHTAHPDIHPDIECPGHKTALSLFLENKLDVLFYYKENVPQKSDINYIKLGTDNLVCLMPAAHPLAQKESLSIKELADFMIIACNPLNAPLSITAFQEQLSKHHKSTNLLYCNSIEIAHCMVAAGIGITILPGFLCLKTPEYATVTLTNNSTFSFGLFYHKRNTNIALKKFLTRCIPLAEDTDRYDSQSFPSCKKANSEP